MPVAITYSFSTIKTLDLLAGPSLSNPFVLSTGNGGFYAGGDHGGTIDLEVFNASGNQTASATGLTGTNASVSLMNSGDVVIASEQGGTIYYTSRSPAGAQVIASTNIGDTGSSHPDVAVLPGSSKFVVVNEDAYDAGPVIDIEARIYNPAGTLITQVSYSGPDLNRDPSVCGLADGGFAMAWEKDLGTSTEIWYGVYNGDGSVRKAPALFDTTGTINRNVSLTASGTGFFMAYEDNEWAGGDTDISLAYLDQNGAWSYTVNGSQNSVEDVNPYLTRLSSGLLALSYGSNPVSEADTNTLVSLFDITSSATASIPLTTFTVAGGEPVSDDTNDASLAGFGLGKVAVFHRNNTDADIDGEALQIVKTWAIDGNVGAYIGSDFVDVMTSSDAGAAMYGGENNDIITGGNGRDEISGDNGSDIIAGGGGNDLFRIRANAVEGVDTITGGDGAEDTLDFFDFGAAVWVRLDALAGAEAQTRDGPDLSTRVWRNLVELTDNSVERANGSLFNDEMYGNASNNTLNGGNGADRLFGEGGQDFLNGGDGNDSLNGGDGNDFLLGNAGADIINGNAGNDSLFFDAQDISIDGGAGTDTAEFDGVTSGMRSFDFASTNIETLFWLTNSNYYRLDAGSGGTRVEAVTDNAGTEASFYSRTTTLDSLLRVELEERFADDYRGFVTDYDAANAQAWSYILQVHDANIPGVLGALDYTDTNYDDGRRVIRDEDQTSSFNWSSITTTYTSGGAVDYQDNQYDDSSRVIYDGDQDNAFVWTSVSTTYAPGGAVDYQDTHYDNGRRVIYDSDQANAYNWTTQQTSYAPGNVLDVQDTYYDAGESSARIIFDWDQDSAYYWKYFESYYDTGGNLTTQRITRDDNSVVVFNF